MRLEIRRIVFSRSPRLAYFKADVDKCYWDRRSSIVLGWLWYAVSLEWTVRKWK